MKAIDGIHTRPELHRSTFGYLHSEKGVLGWSHEQLGWPLNAKGVVIDEL